MTKHYNINAFDDPTLISNILDSNVLDRHDKNFRNDIADWLNENCHGWKYIGLNFMGNGLTFSFEDDTDFVAFKLMWG